MMLDEPIHVVGSVSFGWLHEQMGVVVDEPYFMDPVVHQQRYQQMYDYVVHRFPDYEIYNHESNLVQVEYWNVDQILVGAIQPNLILGGAVGAEFRFFGDKDPDITLTPLKDIKDLAPLRDIDWENTYPTNRFLQQIDEVKASAGPDARVIPPFFWDASGRAVIHGPVTTAQKLMGERFYIEFLENPQFAHDYLDWIADAYISLIRLFATRGGLDITSVHIGDCSACMVSPDQFAEFGLPPCQKIIDALGPGRMHSCGLSDHLMEAFSTLRNMSIINTGSNTSVARMREMFGHDYKIEVAPDAQMLCFGSTDDVRAWVQRTLDENEQGPLRFVYHLDLGYPVENLTTIHDVLIEKGYVQPGRRREGLMLKEGAT